jgi:hypothetical protein
MSLNAVAAWISVSYLSIYLQTLKHAKIRLPFRRARKYSVIELGYLLLTVLKSQCWPAPAFTDGWDQFVTIFD